LENFRPIAVWGTDLALFYLVTHGAFGEAWLGNASWLQVFGLFMLLSGTATYNASLKWPCLSYPRIKGEQHTMTPGMDRIMSSPAMLRGTPGRGPYRPVDINVELGEKGAVSRTTDDFPQAQYGTLNPINKTSTKK
jgi:hypothetical protein